MIFCNIFLLGHIIIDQYYFDFYRLLLTIEPTTAVTHIIFVGSTPTFYHLRYILRGLFVLLLNNIFLFRVNLIDVLLFNVYTGFNFWKLIEMYSKYTAFSCKGSPKHLQSKLYSCLSLILFWIFICNF